MKEIVLNFLRNPTLDNQARFVYHWAEYKLKDKSMFQNPIFLELLRMTASGLWREGIEFALDQAKIEYNIITISNLKTNQIIYIYENEPKVLQADNAKRIE